MPATVTELGEAIHVGDVGTELVVAVVEWDEDEQEYAPVNIAAATTLTVYLTRPRVGTAAPVTLTKTAVLDTTGTDGLLRYNTIAGDLSVAGTWEIQGYVAGVGGWSGSTLKGTFVVKSSRHG